MTRTTTTIAEVREAVGAARAEGGRVAFVPTMGALHAGHLALVARARDIADLVVVSVFVNPLQFGPQEDFARYPRDLDTDLALLSSAGADVLFAPGVAELLPEGATSTRVTAGPVGSVLEGRIRPGHFDGMLTIVLKLLHVVGPDVVVFGQKDAQQVFLVGRMLQDLDVPVALDVVQTVREPDGLALSSRNAYLTPEERALARVVPAALDAAESSAGSDVGTMVAAAKGALAGESGADLEYLAVVEPATFRPVDDRYRGRALVLVAARVGGTRLIDNRFVHLG